jgi:hypothetical protein
MDRFAAESTRMLAQALIAVLLAQSRPDDAAEIQKKFGIEL